MSKNDMVKYLYMLFMGVISSNHEVWNYTFKFSK